MNCKVNLHEKQEVLSFIYLNTLSARMLSAFVLVFTTLEECF